MGGDEDWHLHDVDLATGQARDLTPVRGRAGSHRARRQELPGPHPRRANRDNPELHDVYWLELESGDLTRSSRIPGSSDSSPTAGSTFAAPSPRCPTAGCRCSCATRRKRLAADTRRRPGRRAGNPAARVQRERPPAPRRIVGRRQHEQARLARRARTEPSRRRRGPAVRRRGRPPAPRHQRAADRVDPEGSDGLPRAGPRHRRRHRHAPAARARRSRLRGRDDADRTWLVALHRRRRAGPLLRLRPAEPTRRRSCSSTSPSLSGYKLAPMEPFAFTARDGLTIHGYLTFPPGAGAAGLPMVLNVHGGPWAPRHLGLRPRGAVARQPRLRCACRSTSAARPATARRSSTPATASGAARCTTTCSTRWSGRVEQG